MQELQLSPVNRRKERGGGGPNGYVVCVNYLKTKMNYFFFNFEMSVSWGATEFHVEHECIK